MPVKKSESTQTSTLEVNKEVKEPVSAKASALDDKRISALEEKLNALIEILNLNPSVTANCPKDSEGKRKINL
jgi:hypothetical protein